MISQKRPSERSTRELEINMLLSIHVLEDLDHPALAIDPDRERQKLNAMLDEWARRQLGSSDTVVNISKPVV